MARVARVAFVNIAGYVVVSIVRVRLIVFVTVDAREDHEITWIRMAVLARHPYSLMSSGIDGEDRVMVKIVFPRIRCVTIKTSCRETRVSLVGIILVTRKAIVGARRVPNQFKAGQQVARRAIQRDMCAEEREARLSAMVERRSCP